jgi:hypothetical protein
MRIRADTGERELRWLCRAAWKQIWEEYEDDYGVPDGAAWRDIGPFLDLPNSDSATSR